MFSNTYCVLGSAGFFLMVKYFSMAAQFLDELPS
jgi:hypothetical protein